jgi:homopolymeric O-antigen transport system permease protein
MKRYLRELWACRYFWVSLVVSDLRARYRGSLLGLGWSLLNPIAMTVILCTVFHRVFHADVAHYVPFLLTGLAAWQFLAAVTMQGCTCFQQAEPYIRQFPAPLVIYPLRTTLGAMIHFLVALAVVIVVACVVRGPGILVAVWCLVPALVLLLILGLSIAVLTGLSNTFFRDTRHLCEVGLPLCFYASPIMYEAKILHESRFAFLAEYNPLGAILQLLRDPIVEGHMPSLATFGLAAATVGVVAAVAGFCLARWQARLIFAL